MSDNMVFGLSDKKFRKEWTKVAQQLKNSGYPLDKILLKEGNYKNAIIRFNDSNIK